MFPPRPPALLLCALLLLPGPPGARADGQRQIVEVKARAGNFTAEAISDNGRFLLTGEDDGLVTLWNVKTGGCAHNFTGHPSEVFAAALLPDGKRGVTCGDDNMVVVWDLATGARLHQMSTGHSIPLAMSCSPDGSLAATGCNDGQIMIWSLAGGRRVATLRHPSPLCGILFSPDGRCLAAGYMDGRTILWDTASWSEKRTLPDADGASIGALAFSPESRLLATGNQNGGGFVWNLADGTLHSSFAGYANPETTPSPPVAPVFPGSTVTPDNRGAIVYLCFSRDGSMLLGSIQDEPPRYWETKTGRFLGTGDWFGDKRFYIARYGFTFATAAITPSRAFIATMGTGPDDEDVAEVWRLTFTPNPPEQ